MWGLLGLCCAMMGKSLKSSSFQLEGFILKQICLQLQVQQVLQFPPHRRLSSLSQVGTRLVPDPSTLE